jgi:hypothetical protein
VTLRGAAPFAGPATALAVGLALGLLAFRDRVLAVTIERGGEAYRTGAAAPQRLPATLTLADAGHLRLRVVNRDTRSHAVGVLSVPAGDSVEVRPDVCAPAPSGGALVVLVR